MPEPLITIQNVSKHFPVKPGLLAPVRRIQALDGVSLEIEAGEAVGLVGESGSGKTTLSHLVLSLMQPDEGTLRYRGKDLAGLKGPALKQFRKEVQIVFQAGFGALDPLKTVRQLLEEPLRLHGVPCGAGYRAEALRLLSQVGLEAGVLGRRPGQLSGGQRQRVGIARALAVQPTVLVLDEPVSALDVSVQGQIVNLLLDLKAELGLTYLFITHDLKVARHLCDRLAVMHQGRLVEVGATERVMEAPEAPYTRQLMASVGLEGQSRE